MIALFPDPYPDELLYSLCARYSDRMQYPTKSAINRELFGKRHSPCVDLPVHLSFLTAATWPGHSCSNVDNVIEQHTLWPFYRPFLSVEKQQAVLSAIKGETGYGAAHHAGTVSTDIPRPEWLRYCPQCVTDDREPFGECYWHRGHQIPGVPADLLAWLHCSLDRPAKVPWLGRLVPESDHSVHHPLRHLLFIHFLGHTSQTFFALPLERQPFGQGPWPCLNPVCPHYQQPVIDTYRLESRQHTRPVRGYL